MRFNSSGAFRIFDSSLSTSSFFHYDKGNSQIVLGGNNDPVTARIRGDLILNKGQHLTDGDGTSRLSVRPGRTQLRDDIGNTVIDGNNGSFTDLYAYSGQPVRIRDVPNSQAAVKYLESTKKLELTNADLDLNENQIHNIEQARFRDPNWNSSDHLYIVPGGASGGDERLYFRWWDNSAGTSTKLMNIRQTGVVEVHSVFVANNDIQMETGKGIRDNNGNDRFSLGSGDTRVLNEAGNIGVLLNDGTDHRLYATASTPVTMFDGEHDQTGVRYFTGNPGTLDLQNADLVTKEGVEFRAPGDPGDTAVYFDVSSGGILDVSRDKNGTNTKVEFALDDGSGSLVRLYAENGELKADDSAGNTTTLT
jgi:hypothetical protein